MDPEGIATESSKLSNGNQVGQVTWIVFASAVTIWQGRVWQQLGPPLLMLCKLTSLTVSQKIPVLYCDVLVRISYRGHNILLKFRLWALQLAGSVEMQIWQRFINRLWPSSLFRPRHTVYFHMVQVVLAGSYWPSMLFLNKFRHYIANSGTMDFEHAVVADGWPAENFIELELRQSGSNHEKKNRSMQPFGTRATCSSGALQSTPRSSPWSQVPN